MYINVPNYEAEQAITNRVNAKTRHCRIGKVRLKTGVPWVDKPWDSLRQPVQPVIPGPLWNEGSQPWWMRGPWCNQATGGGYVRESRTDEVYRIPPHGVVM